MKEGLIFRQLFVPIIGLYLPLTITIFPHEQTKTLIERFVHQVDVTTKIVSILFIPG